MPFLRTDIREKDIRLWSEMGKLRYSVHEVLDRISKGSKISIMHSTTNDPGEDWGRMLLDGEEIGFWVGY